MGRNASLGFQLLCFGHNSFVVLLDCCGVLDQYPFHNTVFQLIDMESDQLWGGDIRWNILLQALHKGCKPKTDTLWVSALGWRALEDSNLRPTGS